MSRTKQDQDRENAIGEKIRKTLRRFNRLKRQMKLAKQARKARGPNPMPVPDPIAAAPDEVIRISPWAYLRSMWTLYWSCLLHPFTRTVIDLTTGRVIPPHELHGPPSSDDHH